jgi:hypothetical protein
MERKERTMTPERFETLQETMQGCLKHAHLFRAWLDDGVETTIVRAEYDGLLAMVKQVFEELATGVRDGLDAADALEAMTEEYKIAEEIKLRVMGEMGDLQEAIAHTRTALRFPTAEDALTSIWKADFHNHRW